MDRTSTEILFNDLCFSAFRKIWTFAKLEIAPLENLSSPLLEFFSFPRLNPLICTLKSKSD